MLRIADTAGFCFGVQRAVDMAYSAENACTYGELIHNADVIADLKARGVEAIDSLDGAAGRTVIIRSHGVGLSVYEELEKRDIPYIDATCPFVKRIQNTASREENAGAQVIIVGDKDHPEVKGIAGHCKAPVIVPDTEGLADFLTEFCQDNDRPCAVMPQTTYSVKVWEECTAAAEKFPQVKVFDTICRATCDRQAEAERLARECELMIVLGGHNSSNTKKLAAVCGRYCECIHAENLAELMMIMPHGRFHKDTLIGITAGASTPAHIIKEVANHMSEQILNEENFNFEEALDASFKRIYTGNRVKGTVMTIGPTEIAVDLGAKQSGFVSLDELTDDPSLKPSDIVSVGDEIDLIVVKINDAEGTVACSKKRVDAMKGFDDIVKAKETGDILEGTVTGLVKGGAILVYQGVRVFIPKSQATARRDDKIEDLVKTTQKFKVIEVNEQRNRAVGSIRQVLSAERDAVREKFWDSVNVGDVFKGEVKSLTSYGAFVDLGGIDGMVHISELSWDRIKHPSEVVSVGDELEVYIKDLDREKNRISLGFKKDDENPWVKFEKEYQIGDVVTGKVVSVTPFGAFVRIMPGIDGLVHISQLADRKVNDVKEVVNLGDEVTAKITGADIDAKRISLSIRALSEDED